MKIIFYIWAFLERFGTNVVSLLGYIVLSYLLNPEDFGLVSMTAIFTSLIYVFVDCGLSDGLLREKKPANSDFNTLFFFNLAIGAVLAFVFFAISAPVARYFGHPEIRGIMIAFGSLAVLSGLTISQIAKLRSQLQFKKIAAINISSTFLALAVAIGMAYAGLRYWALVELQLGYLFFYLVFLLFFSKWNLKPEFDVARFKQLWAFGVNLLFSTFVTQISQNIFTFILGKFYNPAQAGYMGQAQKLQQAPTNSLENSISITSYTLIAKKETAAEKRDAIITAFGLMTLTNALLCALLLAVSKPLITVIFPQKWLPVIPYLNLMLAWALIYPVNNFMMIIFKLFNKTSIIRNVLVLEKCGIIVVALLLYPLGVPAMICGAIALSILSFCLYSAAAQRVASVPYLSLFRIFAANIAVPLMATAVAFAATQLISSAIVALIVGTVVFLVTASLLVKFLRAKYYSLIFSQVRSLLNHKTGS